jgi:cobalt-zinc-cadmium efflux system outer membrane protein
MRTFYLGVILTVLIPWAQAGELTSQAEPAAPLPLQEAIRLALEANPEIAVAMREQKALEASRLQAGTRPNPSLSTFVETTGRETQKTTLQLDQPIELGDKRTARLAAADARINAAAEALKTKQADIQASVRAAFYEVLAAQERLNLARSSLDLAGEARIAAEKRVQAGKISPVEETRARLAESAVKIEVGQAVSTLSAARKRLAFLWGNSLPRFTQAQGDLQDLSLVDYEAILARLDQSPSIKLARREIETRQALAHIEKTKRTPDVTISLGAQRDEELGANQAILGFTVPIPVFDRNEGNLQEALSRADKAQDELAALRLQLESQLAAQYERYLAANQAIQTLQAEILPGAQSAFDAAAKGFQYGKFSYLEVLDAQRTLFQAKNQHLNALVEMHQAVADIERILGEALPRSELRQ